MRKLKSTTTAIALVLLLSSCTTQNKENIESNYIHRDVVLNAFNNQTDCEELKEVKNAKDIANIVDDFYLCFYINNTHNRKIIESLIKK